MEVANMVIVCGSVVTAVTAIIVAMKKLLDFALKPVTDKVDCMDRRQCRSFLVDFLADVEHGVEKDEVQIKYAHELYDHYTNDLHANSYIHDKWERVMSQR